MKSLRERLYSRAERKVDYLKSLSPAEQQNAIDTPLAGVGTFNPMHPVSNLAGNGGFEIDTLAEVAEAGSAAAAWPGVNVAPADAGAVEGANVNLQGGFAPPSAEASATPPAADETVDADGKPLTKTALQEILKGRGVAYESDANLERLQTLVRENPAQA